MIPEIIQGVIDKSSYALKEQSKHYPSYFNGKVPLKVRMNTTVSSDMPFFIAKNYQKAIYSHEYYVSVNSHGAVAAIFEDGSQLGLKPGEFQVIEFHPQT